MRKFGLSLALAAPLAVTAIPSGASAAPASLTSPLTGGGAVAAHASAIPAKGTQAPLVCTTSRPSSSALRSVEIQTFNLVNRRRQQAGRKPLRLDSRIVTAARRHSEVMAKTGVFAHVVPGEQPVPNRLRAQGVTFTAWGENIFRSWCRTSSGPGWDVAAFAQQAVTGWMNSPPHRAAILNPNYNYAGLGVAAGLTRGTAYLYATQDFIRR